MRFLTEERRVPNDSPMSEFSFRLPRREVRVEEMDWKPRKRWSEGVCCASCCCWELDAIIVMWVISRTLGCKNVFHKRKATKTEEMTHGKR